jgi:hypothetical protein
MTEIQIGLLTRTSLASREAGAEFLGLLLSKAPQYSPEKYNHSEPINQVFVQSRIDDALDSWGDEFLWKRQRPKVLGQVLTGGPMVHDVAYLSVAEKAFDVGILEGFVEAVHSQWPVDIAYGLMMSAADMEDINHYKDCVVPFGQGLTSRHLEKHLPWLPWLTFFGPAYVEMFGKEKLLAAPAHRVEACSRDLMEIQLTERVQDCVKAREEVETVRASVIEHLNEGAFYGKPGPDGAYRSPEFRGV